MVVEAAVVAFRSCSPRVDAAGGCLLGRGGGGLIHRFVSGPFAFDYGDPFDDDINLHWKKPRQKARRTAHCRIA